MKVGALLVLAGFILWVPEELPWVSAAVVRITRTGWAAAWLLMLSLSVSPFGRMLGKSWPLARWRRRFGLGACLMLGLHIGCVLRAGWVSDWLELLTEPSLRSGASAGLVLLLLGLTSYPSVVRGLRLGHWKLLHRSVYPAGLLVLHHVALSGHVEPRWVYALGGVLGSLLLWRIGDALIRVRGTGCRPRSP